MSTDHEREPTLREVTTSLKAFKELMIERDRRYEERFLHLTTGQENALTALEKQTAAAFAASEKAIVKAEDSQKDYNTRSNEFRAALDDANKHMMPRPESEQLHRAAQDALNRLREETGKAIELSRTEARVAGEALSKEIANLRESRSQLLGVQEQRTAGHSNNQWAISVGIAAAGTMLGLAYFLTNLFSRLVPVLAR